MLRIRHQQMSAFEEDALRRFEKRAASDLRTGFPDECEEFSEAELLGFVHRETARSRSCGIETTAGITVWLHLALLFGEQFDRNPEFPWAAQILTDPQLTNEPVRVRRLYDAAVAQLDSVESDPRG